MRERFSFGGTRQWSPAKQKEVLEKFLSCDPSELKCLQRCSNTGSVWRHRDMVYKLFLKGLNGRSLSEQARFEAQCWNVFFGSFMPRYASAACQEPYGIGIMIASFVRSSDTTPSYEMQYELAINMARRTNAKIPDLTGPGNCLLTPDNKVIIVDFGEQVFFSSELKRREYISDMQKKLREARGDYSHTQNHMTFWNHSMTSNSCDGSLTQPPECNIF